MNRMVIGGDVNVFNEDVSDSESGTYDPPEVEKSEDSVLIDLDEGSEEYFNLKYHFFISIGTLAERCSVVSVRRLAHCSHAMGIAQLEAFKMYAKALAEKNGGNPNLKLGWYCASMEGVAQIVKNGFGSDGIPMGPFGFGLCIYAGPSAADCILSSAADSNGLRQLIMCRLLLGRTEEVLPGSKPYGPSSGEFDSGVDNQQFPNKYIIWYSDAKTRVLPLYVLTVQLNEESKGRTKEITARPHSPWVSFSKLIYTLSKWLSPSKMCLIKKLHIKYLERKISRLQLVTHLRQTVGDELLISVIRSFHEQLCRTSVSKVSPLQRHKQIIH